MTWRLLALAALAVLLGAAAPGARASDDPATPWWRQAPTSARPEAPAPAAPQGVTYDELINLPFLVAGAAGTTSPPPSTIESDSFDGDALQPFWTFVNPRGDASATVAGGRVALAVPAAVSHDVWTGGNFAPRLMQPANDTDFDLVVKFDSLPVGSFANHGVIVEQDFDDYLRFDIYSQDANHYIYAASFLNGTPTRRFQQQIGTPPPPFMRIRRFGDVWVQMYSYDLQSWTIGAAFSFDLTVTKVGVFAGNAGTAPPAYTGLVDFFGIELP